jgi:hypothetical protein
MHHQPDLEQAILDLEWMQRAMALQRVELYINLLLMPLSLSLRHPSLSGHVHKVVTVLVLVGSA